MRAWCRDRVARAAHRAPRIDPCAANTRLGSNGGSMLNYFERVSCTPPSFVAHKRFWNREREAWSEKVGWDSCKIFHDRCEAFYSLRSSARFKYRTCVGAYNKVASPLNFSILLEQKFVRNHFLKAKYTRLVWKLVLTKRIVLKRPHNDFRSRSCNQTQINSYQQSGQFSLIATGSFYLARHIIPE